MNKISILLASVAAALVGCASPVPVAQNFDAAHQKVARTAHHWDIVAGDVAAQTLNAVSKDPRLMGRGIYIANSRATAFNTAFREFMITRLVNEGANVSVCKTDESSPGFAQDAPEVVVTYETQLVQHAYTPPDYQPGRYTALALGVLVIRNIILGGDETTGTIAGVALGEFGAGHLTRTPATEIVVTTTIAEHNKFVMRRSDVYYVPDEDAALFSARVTRRPTCNEDKAVSEQRTVDRADVEAARAQMFAREMKRANPNWQGRYTSGRSFAY
ncbi:hypothetical protein [Cognatazoarcus halotolerans]|uniref:hypothetical protein n=1 Tax=Cognatazoarcus halotolerans TaxID=2686016 RepID=UPI0013589983|nr:hypothetical protein [Cognatazoarcus halotolerans]MCB1899234.1 hypothetical protein [Rhodocyclaceae bacterium]MCP5310731.1 hypothetical protein [Zoogloeaceae bacterium]MCP5466059.1 hypothetical protein [Nevskiaceae bacterium]